MNIIFVSAILPYPLHSGGQVRIYNLLKKLSSGHAISLLSFIRNQNELQYLKHLTFFSSVDTVLRGRVWQARYFIKSAMGMNPLLYSSYENREMKSKITEILRRGKTDLIHIEPSYVWPSLPVTSKPVVVAEHNIEYKVYKQFADAYPVLPIRVLLKYDVAKHKLAERHVWERASHITAVSEDDASRIRKHVNTPVTVIPNGVDLEYFNFRQKTGIPSDPLCLFVGTFAWVQNQDALEYLCDKVWPVINTKIPKAKLRIVGRQLPKSTIQKLHQIKAEVNENAEDIRTEYSKADFLIAPIRVGGGTKYKILESMASGLPVITTHKGAEGLPLQHDAHVLLADTPDEFAQSMLRLMKSPDLVHTITSGARKIVSERFSWETIATQLETVWKTYETKN